VVIGAGGGGIPVVRTEQGDYQSVDAVIDKDLSTALLAREIGADVLVITTGVEKVCMNFGKPTQQALDTVNVAQMTRYMEEGISRRAACCRKSSPHWNFCTTAANGW
jgi:carbamate kinase